MNDDYERTEWFFWLALVIAIVITVLTTFFGCETSQQNCVLCDLPVDCHGNQKGSPNYNQNCK